MTYLLRPLLGVIIYPLLDPLLVVGISGSNIVVNVHHDIPLMPCYVGVRDIYMMYIIMVLSLVV